MGRCAERSALHSLPSAARRHDLRRRHCGLPGGRVRAHCGAGGPAGVIGDKSGGGRNWRLHCSRLDAADPYPRRELSTAAWQCDRRGLRPPCLPGGNARAPTLNLPPSRCMLTVVPIGPRQGLAVRSRGDEWATGLYQKTTGRSGFSYPRGHRTRPLRDPQRRGASVAPVSAEATGPGLVR